MFGEPIRLAVFEQSLSSLTMQGWQCVSKFCNKVATCLGYVDVSDGNENDLLNAVYTLGPVRYMTNTNSAILHSFPFVLQCHG